MPVSRRFRLSSVSGRRAVTAFFDGLEARQLLSSVSLGTRTTSTVAAVPALTRIYTPPSDISNAKASDGHKAHTQYQILAPATGDPTPFNSPSASGKSPLQIRTAYGVSSINFGSIVGDGTGQTIAIIDAYDDVSMVSSTASNFASSDLARFDAQYGLPDPVFTKVNSSGGTAYPSSPPAAPNPDSGWDGEIALDVEWSHVMAPKANIILVEATNSSSLFTAVNWARQQPGISAITMSFGSNEYSGEAGLDTYFTTPSGHAGITYLASTGDSGVSSSPASSSRVVAVGGTALTLGANSVYSTESGWNAGGGGISPYITKPSYQTLVTTQSTTKRTTPDVAAVASPNTGVNVLDTSAGGIGSTASWGVYGGTSLSSPLWAGLIADADQGRALEGLTPLDGPATLQRLYTLSSSDFHDVIGGSNSSGTAVAGYDLVTGRGTPKADSLIPHLAGGLVTGTVFGDYNGSGTLDGGETGLSGVSVYADLQNNGVKDAVDPTATTDASGNYSFDLPGGVTYAIRLSGTSGFVNTTGAVSLPATVSYGTTSASTNFSLFPTTLTGSLFTVRNNSGASQIQVFNTTDTSGTPAYAINPTAFGATPLTLAATSGADSYTLDFSNGALIPSSGIKITGTTAADAVHVVGSSTNDLAVVTTAGLTFDTTSITLATLGTLDLQLGSGNDLLQVNSLSSATSLLVDLGTGTDQVDFGDATGTIDAIAGNVSISSGAAGDTIVIDDRNSGFAHTYTAGGTASAVSFDRSDNFGSLTFNAGPSISLYTGAGDDTVMLTPTSALALTLDADKAVTSDNDTLFVSAAANTFALTANGSQGGAFNFSNGNGTIAYSGVEDLQPLAQTMYFDVNGAQPSVVVKFTSNVSSSLDPTDLTLQLPDSSTVTATGVTYDASTKTATFALGSLVNGSFTATLDQNAVTSSIGEPLVLSPSIGFRFLAGDANGDGIVDFNDLVILAQNYGTTGRNFSQGNFDFSADGLVDFNDLVILAQNFNSGSGKSAPALASTATGGTSASGKKDGSAASRLSELA